MMMRERIARAIYEKRNGTGCTSWGRLPGRHKAPYLSDADAVLAAMAEPTEAMCEEGGDVPCGQFYAGSSGARAIYRAMLAAAGELG